MKEDLKAVDFLSQYSTEVLTHALLVREVLLKQLPDITEQLDLSAKMVAYCYGQKYADLICVLIPSKKGLKLGFNRGIDLPDPDKILEGTAKMSRYVVIKSKEQIKSAALKQLLKAALLAYKERIKKTDG
jgi:hypothetical protein